MDSIYSLYSHPYLQLCGEVIWGCSQNCNFWWSKNNKRGKGKKDFPSLFQSLIQPNPQPLLDLLKTSLPTRRPFGLCSHPTDITKRVVGAKNLPYPSSFSAQFSRVEIQYVNSHPKPTSPFPSFPHLNHPNPNISLQQPLCHTTSLIPTF